MLITPKPSDSDTIWSAELRDAIHNFHEVAQNAVTDDRYIVIGAGATQVLQAAMWAYRQDAINKGVIKKNEGIEVFAQAPYYMGYANYA